MFPFFPFCVLIFFLSENERKFFWDFFRKFELFFFLSLFFLSLFLSFTSEGFAVVVPANDVSCLLFFYFFCRKIVRFFYYRFFSSRFSWAFKNKAGANRCFGIFVLVRFFGFLFPDVLREILRLLLVFWVWKRKGKEKNIQNCDVRSELHHNRIRIKYGMWELGKNITARGRGREREREREKG